MNRLDMAIEMLENKLKARNYFRNIDSTCLTCGEADELLTYLKAHRAVEDTLQFDIALAEKEILGLGS